MTNSYYNQYGQRIPYEQDNEKESHSLGSIAIEGAIVLGVVLAILHYATKYDINYLNIGGQNKHITAPAHSTSPSSTNSGIDVKVEPKLISNSGLDRVVGK